MGLLTPILSGQFSTIARVVLGGLVIALIILLHQTDATYNYHKGFDKAIERFPQNVYNGPTTVIQGKKMTCFPVHIGHFGFGICHE